MYIPPRAKHFSTLILIVHVHVHVHPCMYKMYSRQKYTQGIKNLIHINIWGKCSLFSLHLQGSLAVVDMIIWYITFLKCFNETVPRHTNPLPLQPVMQDCHSDSFCISATVIFDDSHLIPSLIIEKKCAK